MLNLAKIRQALKGRKGSKTFFRVLEFHGKIPSIKKISSEHFKSLWCRNILDEIIKFRWNNKILEQIINLHLMMVLQQNFIRVLLNWAPSSIHLHPALCNTLNVIRTKITHIIWQFSKSWVKKLKVVNFYRKLTKMVFWWCLFQIWT